MIIELAIHSLRHRPLRTVLTAVGIAIAVGSMVVFLSLGEGLRRAFASEVGSIGAELQISSGPLDTAAFSSRPTLPLGLIPEVRAAAAPFGVVSVTPILLYLRSGLTPGSSFIFQGVPADVDVEAVYPGVEIVAGRGLDASDAGTYRAVVGRQIAERNSLDVGDVLRISPDATFDIVGIVDSSGGLIGNGIVVPLDALRAAIDAGDYVSFLVVDIEQSGRAVVHD